MRRGWTSIEVDVDIEVDEHLEYATDDALLYEAKERGLFALDKKVESDVILDLLCSKYTIIQSALIREFFEKLNQ